VGYEAVGALAQTIYHREGPSGPNKVCCIRMLHGNVFKQAETIGIRIQAR